MFQLLRCARIVEKKLGFDGGYYMTCSKNFGQLFQASCLGLIGMLTIVGCGGSENKPITDGATGVDVPPINTPKANLTATPGTANVGSVEVGSVSTPVTVLVTNNGNAAASITVTTSGAGIVATGCSGTLAAGAPCTLSITASPPAGTAANSAIVGNVSVTAAGANTVTIGVSGTATVAGNFTVSPTAVALGDVAAGATVQATVIVTAKSALTGLTTGVQGTELKFDASSDCIATLAAGASCKVVADFTATATPTDAPAIVVSQGGVSTRVPVTANVLPLAKLAATPLTASLPAVPGSPSAPVDINVGNIGGLSTGTIGVALASATPAEFKITSDKCSIVTLAAGASCVVTVTYNPSLTITTSETATLTITDKGTGASSVVVALTGIPNVIPPTNSAILTLTGGPSLGSVAPGALGGEVLFTVTNTTATPSGPVQAAVATDNGYITISSNTCVAKATLNQGETCIIGLKLAPPSTAKPQTISAVLTVTWSTLSVSAPATGSVVSGPALSSTPPAISFGSIPVNQSSDIQTVTITNTGSTVTGALTVTLSGAGAAQVAKTADTCSGTLATGKICTISLVYSPTDTTGVNGQITVTDGVVSTSIPMVGSGLAPSVLTVNPKSVTFPDVVIGYTTNTQATFTTVTTLAGLDGGTSTVITTVHTSGQTLSVSLVSTATTDSGTIATAITGTNAADFAVDTTNSNCTTIQPGQSCSINVNFTPSGVGLRQAAITVTGSKGGIYQVPLQGTALPLVEIVPQGCEDVTGAPIVGIVGTDYTGLEFGQQTLGKQGEVCKYRTFVRGATVVTAVTTTTTVALATSTPPDFRNVTGTFPGVLTGIVPQTTNPCDAAVLGLTANTGAPATTAAAPAGWTKGTYWTCDFLIQFTPQTSKSVTTDDKTATISASATAGGTDSKTLTGTATGPLTINPATTDFGLVGFGNASAENPGAVTLTVASGEVGVKILTITNNGVAEEGPLSVAIAPAGSTDFGIVNDTCSELSTQKLAVGAKCYISVVFAPTAAGARTATLTVTSASSGETTNPPATLKGSGGNPFSVTVAPATFDFGKVPQGGASATWTTFTISNPASSSLTGKLTYGIGDCNTNSDTNFELFTLLNSTTGYPAGACGDRNTKQLDPGTPCTIQVRFKPTNTAVPGARSSTLEVCVGGVAAPKVPLTGTATPQLTLSGTAIAIVDNLQVVDFGKVARGSDASLSFVVNNNGLTDVTLVVPQPAPFTIASDSGCTNGATLAAGQPCTLKYTVTSPSGTATITPAVVTIGVSNPAGAASFVSTSVTLKATAVDGPALQLYGNTVATPTTGTPIEFGSVSINSTATKGSGDLTLWFINVGGLPATGISSTLATLNAAGAATDGFLLAAENPGTCASLPGQSLAAGDKCSVNIRLKPSTTGEKLGTYTLTGTSTASASVYLRGTAIGTTPTDVYANVVSVKDTVTAFPATALGLVAPNGSKVYFELHNPSASSVTGAITLSDAADFTVTSAATGSGTACTMPTASTVTIGTVCQVLVTFRPSGTSWDPDTRFRVSNLSVGTAGRVAGMIGQVQQPATLQLTPGAATGVKIDTTAQTVDFGQIVEGNSSSLTFTITNVGEAPTAGAVQLTLDTTAGAYAQVSAPCGALAPSATCTGTVTIPSSLDVGTSPTTYTGGTVRATDPSAAAESSAEEYELDVEVVNKAALKITASAATFGTTYVGVPATTSVILTIANGNTTTPDNSGNRQNVQGISLTPSNTTDFILDTPTPGTCSALQALSADGTFKLAGGGSCTVLVTFDPQSVGALQNILTVNGTTAGGTAVTPASVTLTGTGQGDLVVTSANPVNGGRIVVVTTVDLLFTNYGTDATNMLRTTLAGANKAAYAIVFDSCFGQELAGGDSCRVTVEFTGTASTTTAQTAEVTVTDGGTTTNNTATASLKAGGPAS